MLAKREIQTFIFTVAEADEPALVIHAAFAALFCRDGIPRQPIQVGYDVICPAFIPAARIAMMSGRCFVVAETILLPRNHKPSDQGTNAHLKVQVHRATARKVQKRYYG